MFFFESLFSAENDEMVKRQADPSITQRILTVGNLIFDSKVVPKAIEHRTFVFILHLNI
jgi:hypothetical protein